MLAVINDIVASMMVLPNRQVFPLVTEIPTGHLRWSNPQVIGKKTIHQKAFIIVSYQGVVRVFIIKARDLIKADITLLGKGKSDPYVKVKGITFVYLVLHLNHCTVYI